MHQGADQARVPVERAVDQGRVLVAMAAEEQERPALRIVTVKQTFPVMRAMAGERVPVKRVQDLAPVEAERVQCAVLIVTAKALCHAIALVVAPAPVEQAADQGRVVTGQVERELFVLLTVIVWRIWRVMQPVERVVPVGQAVHLAPVEAAEQLETDASMIPIAKAISPVPPQEEAPAPVGQVHVLAPARLGTAMSVGEGQAEVAIAVSMMPIVRLGWSVTVQEEMPVRVVEARCRAPVPLEAAAQAAGMGAMAATQGKETPYWSFC